MKYFIALYFIALTVSLAILFIFLGTKPIEYVENKYSVEVTKDNVDLLVENRTNALQNLSIALSLVERAEKALSEAKELERQAKAEVVRSVEYIELYEKGI